MKQLIFLLGASGHAKMAIEAAQSSQAWEIVCCLDTPNARPGKLLGVPVEPESPARLDDLQANGFQGFVAIGDNRSRRKLSKMLEDRGVEQPTIIHASAWISPSASIGAGSIVMPKAVVGASCKIGKGAIINTAAHIDHDGLVEDFCHVAPGCHIAGNVTIHEGAFLGVGTSVIPEISIGKWVVVGAGATVIRSIPEHEVWIGNPARLLRKNGAL
jgi:UDP-perosamine 4-acetyltransferase